MDTGPSPESPLCLSLGVYLKSYSYISHFGLSGKPAAACGGTIDFVLMVILIAFSAEKRTFVGHDDGYFECPCKYLPGFVIEVACV